MDNSSMCSSSSAKEVIFLRTSTFSLETSLTEDITQSRPLNTCCAWRRNTPSALHSSEEITKVDKLPKHMDSMMKSSENTATSIPGIISLKSSIISRLELSSMDPCSASMEVYPQILRQSIKSESSTENKKSHWKDLSLISSGLTLMMLVLGRWIVVVLAGYLEIKSQQISTTSMDLNWSAEHISLRMKGTFIGSKNRT